MASLLETQRSFAAALRDPTAPCDVRPCGNLGIYRNNGRINFQEALAQTFPVVRRRVGDDYFRQLGTLYRERFPSRSGDLHWVGCHFDAFLDEYLRGGDYAWLADLARIEWSRAECAVAPELPAVAASQLSGIAPDDLERLVFRLQPSLRLHESRFPVFTVWLRNQDENAPPVDHDIGSEAGMVRICDYQVEVRKLPPALFSFVSTLRDGATLAEAVDTARLDEAGITGALAFLFEEKLVSSMAPG